MKYVLCILILGSMFGCKLLDDSLSGTGASSEPDPFCTQHSSATTYDEIGDGSQASPYLLCTATQFKDIAASGCNASVTVACNSDFKLMDDIDLSNDSIAPIGSAVNQFTGTMGGNNKTISNFIVNATVDDFGVFSKLGSGALVENLSFDSVSLETATASMDNIGVLAGQTDSVTIINVQISNLSSNLTGTSLDVAGGMVGAAADTKIQNCSVQGSIIAPISADTIGGVVGFGSNLLFDNVSFAGLAQGGEYVGGILGYGNGDITITNWTGVGTVSVIGGQYLGGLIGVQWSGDLIANNLSLDIHVENSNGAAASLGGLFGQVWTTGSISITNVSVSGLVQTLSTNNGNSFGGIAGVINDAHMENITVTTNINAGPDYVGGIVGGLYGNSTIVNSSYTGNIYAYDCWGAGSLVGFVDGGASIESSHGVGSVSCGPNGTFYLGGLVGQFEGSSIIESSFTGSVIDNTTSGFNDFIGGLVGYSQDSSSILNSYCKGSMTIGINSDNIGGLIGWADPFAPTTVTNSYCAMTLNLGAGAADTGGFASGAYAGLALSNNFWDEQTFGLTDLSFDQAGSVVGEAEGKTTVQMQSLGTFTGAGWDFTNVWKMGASGYPEHK